MSLSLRHSTQSDSLINGKKGQQQMSGNGDMDCKHGDEFEEIREQVSDIFSVVGSLVD